jgi:hypothetical protein
MATYQIDLLAADGARNCLLAIMCAHDLAAIVLAKSIFRLNRTQVSSIAVWRDDRLVFEDKRAQLLN